MKEAVIVSTARTPIGKAYRGAFNNIEAPSLAAHAVRAAVERAGIEAAEVVAERYGISREAQDQYALQSRMRTAAAQEAGLFRDEIVKVSCNKAVMDKETGEVSYQEVTLVMDEGNRPTTTLEGKRRGVKYVVVTMCVGGGIGAAGLFEVV